MERVQKQRDCEDENEECVLILILEFSCNLVYGIIIVCIGFSFA